MKTAPQSGFTLVEALVSTALLSIVLLVVTTIFASTIKTGKEILDIQKLTDETRNVILSLEKEISEGNGINAAGGASCPNICNTLTVDYGPSSTIYSYDALNKKIQKTILGITTPVTSDNIEVTSLKFYVKNSLSEQSRVTVSIKANPKGSNRTANLQATVSLKNY